MLNPRLFLAFVLIVAVPFWGYVTYSHAQATTESATETTTTTVGETTPAIAVDPTTVIAGTGIIGAGTALVNSVLNSRKQKKDIKGTDMDLYKYIRLNNMIWATWSKHKEMTIDQVLDLPISDDPKDLDKTTFREALAKEETDWKEYIDMTYLYKK